MDERPFESMNMIPFIDIMLVLLTIVLTTSSFIASGRIPVNLPQAAASEPAPKAPEQTITLDAKGIIYYQDEAVDAEQLKTRLAPLERETAFTLRADRAVELQHFIGVADVLKQLGFTRVALQTSGER
ncbi:MAG: biopolymer transporter ExbD [Zoogloeaceae bacterium]|nr:biopolymer transporter ExbD [Zoogloeaceae bacterium]